MTPVSRSKQRFLDLASNHNELVNDAIQSMGESAPDQIDIIKVLVGHFDTTVEDVYLNSKLKLAALALIQSPNIQEAAAYYAWKANIREQGAETFILQMLNDSLDMWSTNKAFFESRGLVRGTNKYYSSLGVLQGNSDFNELRKNIDPELRPIIAAAIDCAHSTQAGYRLRLTGTTLTYVLAQLQPEGSQKEELLYRLQGRAKTSAHQSNVDASAKAIVHLASYLGIDLHGVTIKTYSEQAINKGQDTAATGKAVPDEQELLKKDLDALVARGSISTTERKAYLWLSAKEAEGQKPPTMALQSILMTRSARVSFSDAAGFKERMNTELATYRTEVQGNAPRLGF